MSKLEQRLEQLDAAIAAYDVTVIEHCKWAGAKLREAIGLAKEFMNKPIHKYSPNHCRFCYAHGPHEEDPDVKDHEPDCKAQKFLEG